MVNSQDCQKKTLDEKVYSDKYISIYTSKIVLKLYYFPFGSKTIHFDDVEWVQSASSLGLGVLEMKGWGMGMSMIWWACHLSRGFSSRSSQFVIKLKNKSLKCGFAVENPHAFNSHLPSHLRSAWLV